MIQLKNVYKDFDKKPILKNINFNIEPGTIVGLVGVNGAGKSTLLRTIMGIYSPNSGEILFENKSIENNPELKEFIGYVADKNEYFNKFYPKSILRQYELTYKNFDMNKFYELNKTFNAPLNSKLEKLSKGNVAKVFFMLALSINPKLLVLDEPTSGLDPIAKRNFLKMLVDEVYENKTTVLISSHNLNDLEAICDKIIFIDNGEIVENNSLDNLKSEMKKLQVIFKDKAPSDFNKWPEFIAVEKFGKSYNVITSNYSERLINKLNDSGALFIEELDLTLEDMLVYKMENK